MQSYNILQRAYGIISHGFTIFVSNLYYQFLNFPICIPYPQ